MQLKYHKGKQVGLAGSPINFIVHIFLPAIDHLDSRLGGNMLHN
jgi:hypothetical protein